MLYITTRDNKDAYTSYRTLCESNAPDGGRFVPFAMPSYSQEEILALKDKTFGQTVAELMNHFYSSKLTGWDIDFLIGRNAAKMKVMSHRIAIAELWRNPEGKFSYIVRGLYQKITNDNPPEAAPTSFFVISVRIAVLFGIYGELLRSENVFQEQKVDISVDGSDFSSLIAAWYARHIGLPIGTIICTVPDGSCLWDFIHRGIFTPNNVDAQSVPEIERLVQATLGFDQAIVFAQKCEDSRTYSIDEELLPVFNEGLFCCVTSQARTEPTINSLFRSNEYIVDEKTAFSYSGLQDYRAKTGNSNMTILLAEINPMADAKVICSATGIRNEKLFEYINFS